MKIKFIFTALIFGALTVNAAEKAPVVRPQPKTEPVLRPAPISIHPLPAAHIQRPAPQGLNGSLLAPRKNSLVAVNGSGIKRRP